MVGIRVSVSLPTREFAKKKWLDEMARAQRQTSVPRLKRLFQRTVFGWSKKPDFGWAQIRTSDSMSITMYPKGEGADIWNLVNAGSPEHTISARTGGLLRFQKGYRAATTPGSLMSRRAYRSNPVWTAKSVSHPGFTARNFIKLIAEEYHNPFIGDMQEAISKVARS